MLLTAYGEFEDIWPIVPEHAPLPKGGYALVPMNRLPEALTHDNLWLGVIARITADPWTLMPHFRRLGMVAVEFPGFKDERGFSLAPRLRTLGFRGRLRATGPVLADQVGQLLSVGFDEVLVPETPALHQPGEPWLARFSPLTLDHQRGRLIDSSTLGQRRPAQSDCCQ